MFALQESYDVLSVKIHKRQFINVIFSNRKESHPLRYVQRNNFTSSFDTVR